jgi:replicative DNA helicase
VSDRYPPAPDAPPDGTAPPGRAVDRVPPHSLEAEVSVLGAALLSSNAASDVIQVLQPEYFYRGAHRVVFEAIHALHAAGEAVDTVTVTDWLGRRDRLDEVGGAAAIHDLTAAVPTAANAAHYARIVREKAVLRRLIEAGTQVVRLGFEASDDAESIVDRAESIIYDVAQSGADSEYARLGDLLTTSFDQIEKLAERGSEVTGLATGFNDLDRLTAGLQPQNLVIVAARPAMGKCLVGATPVVDASTGRRWTIAELVAARPDGVRVVACDADRRLVEVRPSDFVANGTRATFRVRTRSGREVTVTDNHPLLTPDGWRETRELVPGDLVAAPRRLAVAGRTERAHDELALLGHLLGSGTGTDGPLSIRVAGEEAEDDLRRAAAGCGLRVRRLATGALLPVEPEAGYTAPVGSPPARPGVGRVAVRTRPVVTHRGVAPRRVSPWRAWLAGHGLLDVPADRQTVPEAVFTASQTGANAFLSRLLASPAVASTEGGSVLRMPSAAALRDVQHLLLRLGVAARVDATDRVLVVDDPQDAERLSAALHVPWQPSVTGRPVATDGDVLWDEIVSIEPAGMHEVYDLTVPELHNFVAGDLVVHNSSLALGISHYVSTRLQRPSILFSLEMSKLEIVNRLLSTEARIDSSRLRTGRLEESDWRKLGDALGSLAEAPLYIDDTPSITLNEIRAKCRRLQQKQGLDLVIVDYLQLMQSPRRIESRQQEVAEISRGLKMLAKELDVPVLALSQLSRQPESRTDKRPQLADLRESGSIEQDADIVGFIYRDEVYDEQSPDKGIAELIISKHRNGATGVVRLAFLSHLTTFANLARPSAGAEQSSSASTPV